jgi:hypothetical protein
VSNLRDHIFKFFILFYCHTLLPVKDQMLVQVQHWLKLVDLQEHCLQQCLRIPFDAIANYDKEKDQILRQLFFQQKQITLLFHLLTAINQ